jgi:hypothetical protein
MIVTAVASGDATMPEGFARETLQCAACGDIEQRFVFGGASSKRDELESASAPRAAISSSAPADATSPLLPLPLRYSSLSSVPSPGRAPAQVGPSAPAWTRAVEKLRNRQAYIGVRPDQQQSDWNARISQALEKLVPRGHRRRAAGNAAPHGIGAVGGGCAKPPSLAPRKRRSSRHLTPSNSSTSSGTACSWTALPRRPRHVRHRPNADSMHRIARRRAAKRKPSDALSTVVGGFSYSSVRKSLWLTEEAIADGCRVYPIRCPPRFGL